MQSKRCTKCGETKPVEQFHRRSTEGTNGYHSWCKACKNGADKRDPDQQNARATAWYWENKARRQAYVKANRHLFREQTRRRRADPEIRAQINAAAREKRKGNPEHIAKVRAWQKAHPEYVTQAHRRKAAVRRLRKQGQFVDDVDPLVVLERADGICGICGQDVNPLRFDVDHIVPLSKGGEHSYRNTQAAHPVCNNRKGAKAP